MKITKRGTLTISPDGMVNIAGYDFDFGPGGINPGQETMKLDDALQMVAIQAIKTLRTKFLNDEDTREIQPFDNDPHSEDR